MTAMTVGMRLRLGAPVVSTLAVMWTAATLARIHTIFDIVFVGPMETALLWRWRTILAVTRPLYRPIRTAQAIGEGGPVGINGARLRQTLIQELPAISTVRA